MVSKKQKYSEFLLEKSASEGFEKSVSVGRRGLYESLFIMGPENSVEGKKIRQFLAGKISDLFLNNSNYPIISPSSKKFSNLSFD